MKKSYKILFQAKRLYTKTMKMVVKTRIYWTKSLSLINNNFWVIKKTAYVSLLFFFILISLSGYFLGKELPGNQRFLRVTTSSMEPSIKKDSIILIKKMDNYLENEVVTFRPESLTVGPELPNSITHRIINKQKFSQEQWYYQTKGDHNFIADGWIKHSQVIGKVIFKVPQLISKLIFRFLEPRWLRVATLWISLVYIMITEGKKVTNELKKPSKKNLHKQVKKRVSL